MGSSSDSVYPPLQYDLRTRGATEGLIACALLAPVDPSKAVSAHDLDLLLLSLSD
jgi:hypothetical protein